MSKFKGSLAHGKEGERLWEDYLVGRDHTVVRSDAIRGDDLMYWDLEIESGMRFEVKYDQKAWMYCHNRAWQQSPNLFLECWSTTRNERCGLYSSLGQADVFVYIMKHTDIDGRHLGDYAHVFYLEPLISWCEDKSFRRVPCSTSGDDNAEGWLAPENVVEDNKIHNGYISKIELRS